LGDIAKRAGGDNSLRLTFQRFVLAAFLDNVLELASVSLRKMSKGRYYLRRAEESQDKRSAGGLDLVVFDAQTGVERPVSTLSGGESFLASLALALGLAEVVQHYAGGIQLDAIFIDEGFGTLDADALDLAISTLLDLRQGGRMVGVISHVTELRERIHTRLEIKTTRQGSTTHFHLP
jgi:exonuclease SbcC